jgi:hypothetical protein
VRLQRSALDKKQGRGQWRSHGAIEEERWCEGKIAEGGVGDLLKGWGGVMGKAVGGSALAASRGGEGWGPDAGTTQARRRRAAVDMALPLNPEIGEGVGC